MFAVPIGVLLVGARRLNHREIVSCARHELQPYRQIFFRETARHGKRRQSAQIADGPERVRK